MKQGFTMTEVLVVISIMIILLLVTLPLYNSFQVSARLNETNVQVAQALRLARERSLAGYNNGQHGIYLENNNDSNDRYIVYQGTSYASRDTGYDRIMTIEGGLNFSFTNLDLINNDDVDINFSSGLGVPDNTGTIVVVHNSGKTRSIIISSLGLIEEQ